MMNEYYILFPILGLYVLILLWLGIGCLKTRTEFVNEENECLPITIIICARNEEKTLPRCLKTILQQEYDLAKIQILVINDASSDQTASFAAAILKNSGISHKVISNAEHKGKKKCIEYAVTLAEHEYIITRDADTFTTSFHWLRSISDHFTRTKSDMIIGPVALGDNLGSLWALQVIENNVLNVLGCGAAKWKSPFLCSGANLAYTQSAFKELDPYTKHPELASGDDVLFLEEARKAKLKVTYLKSRAAVVRTYAVPFFGELIKQRIRWASKFKVNSNPLNLILSVLTFLVNLAMLFSLFNGFLMPQNAFLGLIFVGIKLLIDILLLFLASGFLKNRAIGWYILPIGLIYPIYACIVAVGSVFMKPNWK